MHLTRRDGRYYFRYSLPAALAAKLQATEIKFSLFTYSKKYATELAHRYYLRCLLLPGQSHACLAEAISFVRQLDMPDGFEPLTSLLKSSRDETLQEAFRILDSHQVPTYKLVQLNQWAYHASQMVDGFYHPVKLDKHPDVIVVPYFDTSVLLSSAPTPDGFLVNFNVPHPIHLHHLVVRDVPEHVLTLLHQLSAPKPAIAAKQVEASPYLAEQVAEFLEMQKTSWTEKTYHDYKMVLNLFLEVIGPKQVLQLTSADYDSYIKVIRKLPKNRKKGKLKTKTLDELLAMDLAPMAKLSIEKYHNRATAFVHWLARRFEIRVSTELPDIKGAVTTVKKGFSLEQLKLILTSEQAKGFKRKHPYQKWLPWLGVYTGARLNELCSLRLEDITETSLHIQGTKTDNSERVIPIHPKLLELGFMEFVEKTRKLHVKKTEGRLFHELKESRDGFGRNASRWFNDKYLNALGITDRAYNFHSFRHTVSGVLNRSQVQDWRICAYLGHQLPKDATESVRSYLNERTIDDLIPCIEAIKYDL